MLKIITRISCVIFIFLLPALVFADIKIVLPLDCELGKNCWISNLPRNYKDKLQVDFLCGHKTYIDHKGTDFALKDLASMYQGVNVLSPSDGIVKAVRDEMEDVNVNNINKAAIRGKECGNGVLIEQDKFQFQLCHLKKGSIVVKVGDKVKQGDRVGQVGLSGNTEYPHLHLSVRKEVNENWVEFDPFYGVVGQCGKDPKPIWQDDSILEHVGTGNVYNYGFSFEIPNVNDVRNGKYNDITIPQNTPQIIGWAEIFSVEDGDIIDLRIEDTKGNTLTEKNHIFKKYQARYFIYFGKKLPDKILPPNLRLVIEYKHKSGKKVVYKKDLK